MTTEQMSEVGLEQELGEQSQTVAPIIPVAEPEVRAVAEAEKPDFDLSTPEGVRKAAEKFPAFRAVFADERNAEKQRTLNEMRRERGTLESIKAHNAEVARRIALGEDPEEVAKETPLYVKANAENIQIEMYKTLFEKAKELDEDSVSALTPFTEQEGLNAEQWQGLAQAAMNAVANKSLKTGKSEAFLTESLDDIPKDSPLWRAIDAHLTKEREAEMTAENLTAARKPDPPVVPSGAVVAGGKTATEIAAMDQRTLDRFTETLSEEDWEKVMTTMYEAARS